MAHERDDKRKGSEHEYETGKQSPPGQAGSSPQPPGHQGPPGSQTPVPGTGTGSPTSGPQGQPQPKPPQQPPGQPKEGEHTAAGEVGETDTEGSPGGQSGAGGGQQTPPHQGGK